MRLVVPRVMSYVIRSIGVGALVLVSAACSSSEPTPTVAWGGEAVEFFEELAQTQHADDFYGVLDFYGLSAAIDKSRAELSGAVAVSDRLRWNSGDLKHELMNVHLADTGALNLVRWSSTSEPGVVVSSLEGGVITHQRVFDLGAALTRGLRASPVLVSRYEDFYTEYARAWSSGAPEDLASLYAAGAVVSDSLTGARMTGKNSVVASWVPGVLVDVVAQNDREAEHPSIFLGPSEYGQDPKRAVGIYQVTDPTGCHHQVAVRWQLMDSLIIDEQRYHEVESFARCNAEDPPSGWWTGLGLPQPSDAVITSVVGTEGGHEIAVHNGTPDLEALLDALMRRFDDAGVPEPRFDSVTFEPSRACAGRSGRILEANGEREVFICIYESDLCPVTDFCEVPASSVRIAVLHELGHAWMLDHLDGETQAALLASTGRDTWQGDSVPWSDRGVEYSADVIAWGLIGENIEMVRIGSPGCQELGASFRLLTNVDPLSSPKPCQDP